MTQQDSSVGKAPDVNADVISSAESVLQQTSAKKEDQFVRSQWLDNFFEPEAIDGNPDAFLRRWTLTEEQAAKQAPLFGDSFAKEESSEPLIESDTNLYYLDAFHRKGLAETDKKSESPASASKDSIQFKKTTEPEMYVFELPEDLAFNNWFDAFQRRSRLTKEQPQAHHEDTIILNTGGEQPNQQTEQESSSAERADTFLRQQDVDDGFLGMEPMANPVDQFQRQHLTADASEQWSHLSNIGFIERSYHFSNFNFSQPLRPFLPPQPHIHRPRPDNA